MEEIICKSFETHKEGINKALNNMPSEETTLDTVSFFKVLGDYTRFRIILTLTNNELCVCDIAEVLSMTKSAISHHLSHLRAAKIVKSRREGKNIFYSLDDKHVEDIVSKAVAHINHAKHK